MKTPAVVLRIALIIVLVVGSGFTLRHDVWQSCMMLAVAFLLSDSTITAMKDW